MKNLVQRNLDLNIHEFIDSVQLFDLHKKIENMVNEYGADAILYVDMDCSGYRYFHLSYLSEETDDEYSVRLTMIADQKRKDTIAAKKLQQEAKRQIISNLDLYLKHGFGETLDFTTIS